MRLMGKFLFIGSLACALGQGPDLAYGSRGNYSEGIRYAPSTGAGLDLVSALVNHGEPGYQRTPAAFRSVFYLPPAETPALTIREIKPRYFYWLDDLKNQPWIASRTNGFEWSTGRIIVNLMYKDSPLKLEDLGAVVRLGAGTPSPGNERVVPVALYHTRQPEAVTGYTFAFFPEAAMRLTFQVNRDGGKTAAAPSQTFEDVLARQPHFVRYRDIDWADGWYRLSYSGWTQKDNTRVEGVVRFYHTRRLGK